MWTQIDRQTNRWYTFTSWT